MGGVVSQIVIYGLKNGNIGAVEIGHDEAILLWEIDTTSADEDKAPVSHIKIASLKEN